MTITATPAKSRGNVVADMIAGLTTGVANIPDAMASAILAGANPVQGLYAIMVGTPLGSIFGSSAFMNVSATSALIILSSVGGAGWAEVQQVNDVAVIPTSLPLPKLPDFTMMPALLLDAIALAIIALLQGAGVSKAYPNPDGNYPNPSGDFVGQGAANIGAGRVAGQRNYSAADLW
jgi:MFS superfamily sulfate permease-like transporter